MKTPRPNPGPSSLGIALAATALIHCSSPERSATGSGGSGALGGTATGGVVETGGTTGGTVTATGGTTGGSVSQGGSTGGSPPTGGTGTGGADTGGAGAATGGAVASGGQSGAETGGAGAGEGGSSAGGGAGGTATGGSPGGGSSLPFSFFIGADVSFQESQSPTNRATLLSMLQMHGFNFIRLRAFVDPRAADGYDKSSGYCDTAHTAEFGKQIKDAGMGLLVDFHYSDNWADPGKQCVPVAWQDYTTIDDLAEAVYDYTSGAITELIAGGSRPDMVQIGNETTPGMLIHRCDSGGQPQGNNPITGSTSNWNNLGALLRAGAQAVLDVDPGIIVSLHIDRGDSFSSSKNWIDNALDQEVPFTAFGESCYQRYQGDPNSVPNTVDGWTTTFAQLAETYPDLKFFAAEYGPLQREINDVLYNMPNQQGIGTFNWEPATSGDWNTGHDLLRRSGNSYTAQPDLALYDQMVTAYADRL